MVRKHNLKFNTLPEEFIGIKSLHTAVELTLLANRRTVPMKHPHPVPTSCPRYPPPTPCLWEADCSRDLVRKKSAPLCLDCFTEHVLRTQLCFHV